MEIKEITSNFGDFMKENGGKIAIALGGGVILYSLIKNLSGGTTLVAPSGYSAYPDATTNANTIIDSVNQNTTYEHELTRDTIKEGFESTNGYIKDGMDKMNDTINSGLGEMKDSITSGMNDMNKNLDQWGNRLNSNISSVGSSVSSTISGLNSTISSMGNQLEDLKNQNKKQEDLIKDLQDSVDGVPNVRDNSDLGIGTGWQSIDGFAVSA